jgi:hypothetical protein
LCPGVPLGGAEGGSYIQYGTGGVPSSG